MRLLAVCLLLAACARESSSRVDAVAAETKVAAVSGPHTVVVFATHSLAQPFAALAKRYEQDHPGAKVDLRCEGGAQLLAAISGGAACDVVAIGDSSLMSRFAAAAYLAAGSPCELTRNRIAIAVAKGNPKQVHTLKDLARSDVRVALGARSSSIGRHARWALSKQQLEVQARAEANTAAGTLQKVVDGACDAAIVYATSFAGIGDTVERIDVPEADNTPVLYSISAMRDAKEPLGAAAFRALAIGPIGQRLLTDAGFLPVGAKGP